MSPARILVERRYDAAVWEVPPADGSGRHALVRWEVEPDPVDAGPPPEVARRLARAFAADGPALYADAQARASVGRVRLPGPLAGHAPIARAEDADALLRAFDAGGHDWTQGAQWIVLLDPGGEADAAVLAFVEALFRDWSPPARWPPAVRGAVKAGVDGDAAGIVARDRAGLDRMEAALLGK